MPIEDADNQGSAHHSTPPYDALMRIDKKSEAGEIKFVVLDRPGSAVMRSAPDALVAQVIADSVRA